MRWSIFLLYFLSFSSAQVKQDEVFPVNTLQHIITLPVKDLSKEVVITRLNELPQAKPLISHGWISDGSSFNSFKEITGTASFNKINTRDKYCNFSVSTSVVYKNGSFEVETRAEFFDKFLSGGKPQTQQDVECLTYYQEMMKEYIPLLTEYLAGKKSIHENQDEILNKAAHLTAEGKTLEALKLYNKILASDPDNGLALFNKAQILFSLKKYNEALNVIHFAEKKNDLSDFDNVTYKNLKIQILILTKQTDKAVAEINKALRFAENTDPEKAFQESENDTGEKYLVPSDKTGLLLKSAGYLYKLNRQKEALGILKKYEDLIPGRDKKLLYLLFSYYCELKSPENAERIRLLIIKEDPSADLKCEN
ncbi:MAG: tetratricopeptide repeat protein [Chryseobacterium sp.]|jgi:tetratricopeptide (TPR) repeat protein|uniref:tetratricopeptide repeat protein n=1 Tax=Chryseobacterium sp. TaxID=1871047 RepID=UPI00283325EA|nr:tetratricopeptide repeat protein [Chryseobacterium sp.]MDR2237508.1 tetratricopeptide repeat protein [Chryseobacterium sp.]